MIITREFFRFIEDASVSELTQHKIKFQLFLRKMEEVKSHDYAYEARTAIRLIDEEMAARCELVELQRHKNS